MERKGFPAFALASDFGGLGRMRSRALRLCQRRPRRRQGGHVLVGTLERRNHADSHDGQHNHKQSQGEFDEHKNRDNSSVSESSGDYSSSWSMRESDPPRESSLHNESSLPDDEYGDVDAETDENLAEFDRIAQEWIGSDISRWHWYENMKSRRQRLQKMVKSQEESLQHDLKDLRSALTDLDSTFDVGLLDQQSGKITPAGWFLVTMSFVVNVALFYAGYRFISAAWDLYFPSSPF